MTRDGKDGGVDESKDSNQVKILSITLPKTGGEIRDMGEEFAAIRSKVLALCPCRSPFVHVVPGLLRSFHSSSIPASTTERWFRLEPCSSTDHPQDQQELRPVRICTQTLQRGKCTGPGPYQRNPVHLSCQSLRRRHVGLGAHPQRRGLLLTKTGIQLLRVQVDHVKCGLI